MPVSKKIEMVCEFNFEFFKPKKNKWNDEFEVSLVYSAFLCSGRILKVVSIQYK